MSLLYLISILILAGSLVSTDAFNKSITYESYLPNRKRSLSHLRHKSVSILLLDAKNAYHMKKWQSDILNVY